MANVARAAAGAIRRRLPGARPAPLGDNGDIAEVLARLLPAAPVIVEAGAHNGADTLWLSRLRPKGTVHAFEPIPAVFDQLARRTARCKNVRRYNLALSAANGTATMHVSSGGSDASSSLHAPKEHLRVNPHVLFEGTVEVPTLRLDDWAEQNRVGHADLLWLDMQGHELAAMQAGTRLLRTVSCIFTEVNLLEVYEGVPRYPEVRAWLEGQGFRVEREYFLYEDAGNVLFVRGGHGEG